MDGERNDQKNEKLAKLVKEVRTLSKIVNELQEEVDVLKSRASNRNNVSIPEVPKTIEGNEPKTNRLQRLNIFRKDNRTKEGVTSSKIDSSKSSRPATSKQDNQKNVTNQSTITERSFEDKSHRRDHSTQSPASFPKEVGFSCIVETCTSNTDIDFEDSANLQENVEWNSNNDSISVCKGCHKKKKPKIKSMKSKIGKCAKDCPYVYRDNKADKKNQKKKYKSKQKDSVEAYCKGQMYASDNKQCKNKKIMVNITKNDKANARKFISSNDNFSFDPTFFKCPTYLNEGRNAPQQSTKLHPLDYNGECAKVKEAYCKRCFKKCKTKNVLKIKKAILTREPPVIIISPREF